jgi:hypothetical protein
MIAKHIREKKTLELAIHVMSRQAELDRNRMKAEITSLRVTVQKLQSELEALKSIDHATPCSEDGDDARRNEEYLQKFLKGMRFLFENCNRDAILKARLLMLLSFHPDKYMHHPFLKKVCHSLTQYLYFVSNPTV